MPEPFKNLLNPAVVSALGLHLHRAWSGFPRARFESIALAGLDGLELKARAHHLCEALEATLPGPFSRAAEVLEGALAPPYPSEQTSVLAARDDGVAGWAVWPMTEYVARRGRADVGRALAVLHAMTQRFSAEWAIRPFLLEHPAETYATLARWALDPSAHVRRLVSEGSRPRLPWGMVLKPLIADPSPSLPLLRALQDDPSEYVRRSVANHLNDIAKDHPAVVVAWLRAHLPGAPAPRRALLRHASRTLIKQGHPEVLAAWGLGAPLRGKVTFALEPGRIELGEAIELSLVIHATAKTPQRVIVDYAVHHVKADGGSAAKVFKGWALELGPGETRALRKRHAVKPITTRKYYAGKHRVEVLVNGRPVGEAAFVLDLT